MKKVILFFILYNSLCFSQDFQFGIIQDNDGFVNVRKSKELSNNIINKLDNGVAVYHFGAEGNWIDVNYLNKNNEEQRGYVYKDRVKKILDFTIIPITKSNINEITFSNKETQIVIKKSKFDKLKHKLTYSKNNSKVLEYIDNMNVYGTDGNIPKFEYASITIQSKSYIITLPIDAIKNLFEPNINYTTINYDSKTDTLYIQTLNGDGAGGYAVLWVIEKGIYKSKYVTIPF